VAANPSQTEQIHCNAITMEAAAAQGLIDINHWKRRGVVTAAIKYLHGNNISMTDFPLICPEQETLDDL